MKLTVKISVSCMLVFLFGQTARGQQLQKDRRVVSVVRNKMDNTPTSVEFAPGSGFQPGDAQAIFREYLGISQSESKMVLYSTTKTKQNTTVYRYAQYYKGLKVEHSSYSLLAKGNNVQFITGNIYIIANDLSGIPALSESRALAKAIEKVGAEKYMWQDVKSEQFLKKQTKNPDTSYLPKGKLVWIEDRASGKPDRKLHLAYSFNVYASKPFSRDIIYVDATNGKILFVNSLIHNSSGSGQSLYSGNVSFRTAKTGGIYYSVDTTRAAGIYVYNNHNSSTLAPDLYTNSTTLWSADPALDIQWGAEKVYDYWYTQQGRNSFDNAGAALHNIVHFGIDYQNAYWDGTQMVYGDGDPSNGTMPFVGLDITAHEISHAVCQYTADLIYAGESGALNEGLSDIWGAVIENYANPHETDAQAKLTWKLGEEFAGVSRSMDVPKMQGQPDTYGGIYWTDPTGCIPTNGNDQCGVHINSGILNHWFYLLCLGGTGVNDNGGYFNVTGIGMAAAADIVYGTELVLSSIADYNLCRANSISVTTAIYGPCSAEVLAVVNAWYAVGVGKAFNPMEGSITGATNVCIGASISLTDTFLSGTWGSLNTAIATISSTGTVAGLTAGNAVITYTANTACGIFADSFTVKVNPIPAALTVTPSTDTICNNGTVSIHAPLAVLPDTHTLLSQDFNSGTGSWMVDSSGSAWHSPYIQWLTIPDGVFYIHSPDNSGIALSYHGFSPPGSLVKTRLVSPAFSLDQYSSAYLSFQHNYAYNPADSSASVEISTDGGITWASLFDYAAQARNDGNITFSSRTFSLSAYTGIPNLKVSFYYYTTGGDYWLIDNINITGTPKATYTTPSWSPVTDLFTDAALTAPYTAGTKTNTVYTHPTTISTPTVKTYLATSQGGGCTATGSSAIRVATIPTFTAITAKPGTIIKSGQNDTLQAVITNPGSSQTYQWKVNATYISGAVSATYTSNAFADRDTVTCIVTTDGPCGPTMESRSVVIYISNLGVKNIHADAVVTIAPNPNKGSFTITGSLNTTTDEEVSLEIMNLVGQVVYKTKAMTRDGRINEQVQLSPGLANGIYMLNLHTTSGSKVFRFVLGQ